MSDIDKQLVEAARAGGLAGVKTALAAGANIHADEERALQVAADNRHLHVLEYLLSQGADVHINGEYALCWAARHGRLDVARVLVAAGANIHVHEEYPLRTAAYEGQLEVVNWLLDMGAYIHAAGGSALLRAASMSHAEMVSLLLKRGAALKPIIKDLHTFSPAVQEAAMSHGKIRALSVSDLARQGVCSDALGVLLTRQGHGEAGAMIRATEILEPLAPDARAELLIDLMAQNQQGTLLGCLTWIRRVWTP